MRKTPSFEQTTRLVARALGLGVDDLRRGYRRATLADLPDILALRRRVLASELSWDDEAYLRWRYSLDSAATGPCELWCLRLPDQSLVGIIGRQWADLIHAEHRLRASYGMDVLIDPTFEASGVGVWISQAHHQDAEVALAISANDNSLGIIRRLYQALPSRKPYTLPLDFGRLLTRFGLPLWAARIVGWPITRVEPLLYRGRRPALAKDLALRPITRFDNDLLAPLIEGQRQRAEHRVELLRSAAMLNWRLFASPRAPYQVLGAFEGERCVGYIAYRAITTRRGESAMHVIDWLTVGDSPSAEPILATLFDGVISEARRTGCSPVQTVVLDTQAEALLRRFGFLVGSDAPYLVLGLQAMQPWLQALAERPEAWSVTDIHYDSDGCY